MCFNTIVYSNFDEFCIIWRPLGRPRVTWEDNIKMDLQEVGWGHGPE